MTAVITLDLSSIFSNRFYEFQIFFNALKVRAYKFDLHLTLHFFAAFRFDFCLILVILNTTLLTALLYS